MKAIIMAGGEGSRLRPLTCGRPKPMVPVMNRPIMSHIVDLLKKHNLTDIGVTLQYMPEAIRDHFGNGADYGINMRYFVEEVPLGTAGSVKNADDFLDETFVVISGDALTDLDLSQAIKFHRQQGAIATLVLTRVDCPLEYGVVITDQNGRIKQFLEKPAWGEVFSDTVNTGIYILEPEVLNYFEPGQKFDFSKDLFPLLLKDKKPLFGVVLSGYWCDIGNLQQYLQAHHDALSGKVKISVPGHEIAPGIWIGDNVSISSTATLHGPVLIGDGCQIDDQVKVEPNTVISSECHLQQHSSIKRSVLWNNVFLGPGVSLRGAVLGSRVQVHSNASIYEGAVIGSDSIIKDHGIVKPDVKLWPNKMIETGTIVQNSLVWGTRCPKKIFGLEGITGLVNVEMTPEFAARLGAAFASTLSTGSGLAVSADGYPSSQMLKQALTSGMQSAGAQVYDLGMAITPLHRFAVRSLELKGGVHIKVSSKQSGQATLVFINDKGGNISRGVERKVENLFMREDFRRVKANQILPPQQVQELSERYLRSISAGLDRPTIRNNKFSLIMAYDGTNLSRFIQPLARDLNIEIDNVNFLQTTDQQSPFSWNNYKELLPHLSRIVVEQSASAGAILDPNGDHLILIDETGRVIQDDLLTALLALVILRAQGGSVVVPVTAPRSIEALAQRYKGRVIRTKTAIPDFFDKVLIQDELSQKQDANSVSQFLLNFDGLGALTRILEFAAHNELTLAALIDDIPAFFLDRKEVNVPWEAKGRVIRQLIEDPPAAEMELLDGVKVFHPQGWALVLPDPEEPICRVFSEGASMEIAESLSDFYIDRIHRIVNESNAL